MANSKSLIKQENGSIQHWWWVASCQATRGSSPPINKGLPQGWEIIHNSEDHLEETQVPSKWKLSPKVVHESSSCSLSEGVKKAWTAIRFEIKLSSPQLTKFVRLNIELLSCRVQNQSPSGWISNFQAAEF